MTHREFKRLLDNAEGHSEYVIVVNLDIRGFTSFCQGAGGPLNVATYIKGIYKKILDCYFEDASYYKPTGDGLIVIIPYNSHNLKERARSIVDTCLKLGKEFPDLLKGDPMINFDTPKKIGIGIARGAACCISSKDEDSVIKVLDYSGRILNLASRLMDMARPTGLVIHEGFRLDLLDKSVTDLFKDENVYVRGISKKNPIVVHYTFKDTQIPAEFKNPPVEQQFEKQSHVLTLKNLKSFALKSENATFTLMLNKKPLNLKATVLDIICDDPNLEGYETHKTVCCDQKGLFTVKSISGKYEVDIKLSKLIPELDEFGLDETSEITFEISYPIS